MKHKTKQNFMPLQEVLKLVKTANLIEVSMYNNEYAQQRLEEIKIKEYEGLNIDNLNNKENTIKRLEKLRQEWSKEIENVYNPYVLYTLKNRMNILKEQIKETTNQETSKNDPLNMEEVRCIRDFLRYENTLDVENLIKTINTILKERGLKPNQKIIKEEVITFLIGKESITLKILMDFFNENMEKFILQNLQKKSLINNTFNKIKKTFKI